MKILVVSLLRVGDLIMQEGLLNSIRKKFPSAEIHLLVNHSVCSYAKQIQSVNHTHEFPRESLQRNLVEKNRPMLNSYIILNEFLKDMRSKNFDLCYNFTHNWLSVHLTELINIKNVVGIHRANNKVQVGNKWMHYLNENYSSEKKSMFHYIDLLAGSLELQNEERAQNKLHEKKDTICLQVMTSSAHKTWPFENFKALITLLQKKMPEMKVSILGAPSEEILLRNNFSESENVKINILDWTQLKFELQKCSLLITGDTSVQHLAAQLKIKILSLFFNDENLFKTYPYFSDCHVLFSENEINANEVFLVAEAILQNKQIYCKQADHFLVKKSFSGRFLLDDKKSKKLHKFNQYLGQTVWQLFLDNKNDYSEAVAFLLDEFFDMPNEMIRSFIETNFMQRKKLQEGKSLQSENDKDYFTKNNLAESLSLLDIEQNLLQQYLERKNANVRQIGNLFESSAS